MTSQKLHILNGDAIVEKFQTALENEEFIVWREALCQGPLSYALSDDYKELRKQFLFDAFRPAIQRSSANVERHLFDELQGLNFEQFDEVILWFEHDLFCKVNLMCAVSYLFQIAFGGSISILNLKLYQQHAYEGLGEISGIHYKDIFDHRIALSSEEIRYIDLMWHKISNGDLQLLPMKKDLPRLHFFNRAVHNIAVFSNRNGLGAAWIEAKILDILKDRSLSLNALILAVLKISPEIGYGDLQIELVIKDMRKEKRLIESQGSISLS